MVAAGHEVLIVSKPRITCIIKLVDAFRNIQDKIEFRFSISTDNEELMHVWEPNATSFRERIECLKLAFDNGYRTSVSMEPYLSDPAPVIEKLEIYVSKSIWIGVMNHKHSIPNFDDIADIYEEEYVAPMVQKLRKNHKVFWKKSVINLLV